MEIWIAWRRPKVSCLIHNITNKWTSRDAVIQRNVMYHCRCHEAVTFVYDKDRRGRCRALFTRWQCSMLAIYYINFHGWYLFRALKSLTFRGRRGGRVGRERWTGDRIVQGSNLAAATYSFRNFGSSVNPALSVSFGWDAKIPRTLLSGV